MTQSITRITLFKIPSEENQRKLIKLYKDLPTKALKDGKPYVRVLAVGAPKPDQRAQGFTFAAVSVFESQDDMTFYDNECSAHVEIKGLAKSVHEGFAMVYFTNEVSKL